MPFIKHDRYDDFATETVMELSIVLFNYYEELEAALAADKLHDTGAASREMSRVHRLQAEIQRVLTVREAKERHERG